MSTKVTVAKLPTCDLHGGHDAKYDIKIPNDGRWGNVCEQAYRDLGSPQLGLGRGQELVVELKSDSIT